MKMQLLLGTLVLSAAEFIICAETTPDAAVTIKTDFPGGNAKITKIEGGTVVVEPDLRGDNSWFYWYFEATAKKPGRVTFITPEMVINFKNGAIGNQGPAMCTDQGQTWNWAGKDIVKDNTFSHDFQKAGEAVRFAVTIPYLESDLKNFLKRQADNSHLKQSVLTKSREGRAVELLQIGEKGTSKKPVLITARHHAAETIASHVLEGFLEEAISESDEAKEFRTRYVLFAVPFVDKDGVEKGDQGKNRKPHDHNRDYGENSIYPEVQAIKKLDAEQQFRFALDFHCPTLVMPDHQVMYFVGAKHHPAYNTENVAEFAKCIKQGLPKTAPVGPLNWLRDENDPSPKSSRYFGFKERMIMAATLEIPFAPPGKEMDPKRLREYGKVMLKAFVQTRFLATEGR